MSPLDDELRATLRSRADVLTPSPDPLAGIEARARGIRRRRTLASVVGAGVAVAAIAFAVPAVLPSPASKAPPITSPSSTPAPVTDYALDPAKPWATRGSVAAASVTRFEADWAKKHPGSTFSVLFAQRYEPSAQDQVVFVSTSSAGARYGFVTGTSSSSSFLYDEPLAPSTTVLAFSLPGDEARRALLVAAPEVRTFTKEVGTTVTSMTLLAPGVAVAPLEAPATCTVIAPDGTVLFDGPIPTGSAEQPPSAKPGNLLEWPTRGALESDLMPSAKAALAPTLDATADEVELKVLFAGDTDSGVAYLMGQAWKKGSDTAYPFSYAEGGTKGPATFLGPANKKTPPALAFLVTDLPGTSVDQLVVIPTPRTGQVSYDDSTSGSFRPVTGQDHLDGVVIIDRAKGETDDRLEVLDGNGDLDNPTYRGPVAPFLCARDACA